MTKKKTTEKIESELLMAAFMLSTYDNIGWETVSQKQYILVNPEKCSKLHIRGIAAAWSGSGKYEWEVLWATLFMSAVKEALDKGSKKADISAIFNRNYSANNGAKTFSHEKVWIHLNRFFEIEPGSNEKKVKLRIKVHHNNT